MNKIAKKILLISLICIGIGTLLSVIGFILGGSILSNNFVFQTNVIGSDSIDITSQKKYERSQVQKIELNIDMGKIYFLESDNEEVEIQSSDNYKYEVKNNALIIKNTLSKRKLFKNRLFNYFNTSNDAGVIYVYLPRNMELEEIDIQIGAATLDAQSLIAKKISLDIGSGTVNSNFFSTKELEINVGLGEINIYNGDIKDGEIEVGLGRFSYTGEITGNFDAIVGMGEMELLLNNRKEDYNFDLQVFMGSISIGDERYLGVISDKEINARSSSTFDLECAMGSIVVSFQ